MNWLKRNINSLLLIAIVIGLNILGGLYYKRIDLTEEKRFSLSPVTKNFLKEMDDIATVRVFLTGNLPAGMKELEQATRDLLNEFKAYAGAKVEYEFVDLSKMDRTTQEKLGEDLINLGLQPTSLTVIESGEQTQKVIFPGAVVNYKGTNMPITLLENNAGQDQYTILSNSISLLEYKMANTIQKLNRNRPPTVAISQGHGEIRTAEMKEFIETLQKESYAVASIDLNQSYRVDPLVDLLVIAKPTKVFDEKEKYKIDQFLMRGGKILWLLDNVAVDMDSLDGTNFFFAEERDLNLGDMLFKYGIRVNADLVQDMQNTKIEIRTGVVNNAPQMQLFDWLYFPLLSPTNEHPVSKNLAPISAKFCSTLDTIRVSGIEKNILLKSSAYSKALLSPVRVHLGILEDAQSAANYSQSDLPVAVSLEGTFESVFKNRITDQFKAIQDTVDELSFLEQSETTKMIVVGDGDIIRNPIISKKTYPLGFAYSGPNNSALVFDNLKFLLNSIDYLIDDSGLIETRNKEFKLRQLDPVKTRNEKLKWQLINVLVPVLIILLMGVVFNAIRKWRFASIR